MKINFEQPHDRQFGFFKSMLLFLGVFPFFISLAFGPLPFSIFGINTDYIATGLLAALLIIALPHKLVIGRVSVNLLMLSYFLSILPSVIESENISISFYRFIISLGYGLILLLAINVRISLRCYKSVIKIAIFAIYIACFTVIYLYLFSDYSGEIRFLISTDYLDALQGIDSSTQTVDPNMTAMGLVMLFSFSLVGILEMIKSKKRFFLIMGISFLITLSIIILQSRTAMLMLLLMMITLLFFDERISKNNRIKIMLVLLISIPIVLSITGEGIINNIIDRFVNLEKYESNDTGRIDLISRAYVEYIYNIKNLVIGKGYMLTNPHNEYLRNFFDSGIIGGFFHLGFLFVVISTIFRRSKLNHGHRIYANLTLLPYLFMLFTYGHTKTFWVGIAFSWIVSRVKFADNQHSRRF